MTKVAAFSHCSHSRAYTASPMVDVATVVDVAVVAVVVAVVVAAYHALLGGSISWWCSSPL